MEAIPRCSYYQISTSDPISHSPTQRGKGLIPLTEKQGRDSPRGKSTRVREEKTRLDFPIYYKRVRLMEIVLVESNRNCIKDA